MESKTKRYIEIRTPLLSVPSDLGPETELGLSSSEHQKAHYGAGIVTPPNLSDQIVEVLKSINEGTRRETKTLWMYYQA